ncbi:MAG: aromatic acid exporter family protein [Firmicutes bacterium]|nr:aromatic acid exporter family protein [Bacillota bacterium]
MKAKILSWLGSWRLMRWGTALQVVKTGLASGLSWALAQSILQSPRPYFAPLAAILCLQVTVKESVSRGLQRVLGVVAGIVVALVAIRFLGISAWSIGILVFLAMGIATPLRLGPQGIPQVAISALLVMTVGASVPGYAVARILDTILGAMVAVMINALLIPPDFTQYAEQTLNALAKTVAEVLRAIRDDLSDGLDPNEANLHLVHARQVDQALHEAKHAIHQAEDGLQWNYLVRHRKQRLRRMRHAIMVLDHSVTQVRGIARTLFVTMRRDDPAAGNDFSQDLVHHLADSFNLMADAIVTYAELVGSQDQNAATRLDDLLEKARQQRRRLVETSAQLLVRRHSGRFLDIAAVVSDLEKLSEDLIVSAHLLVPLVTVTT